MFYGHVFFFSPKLKCNFPWSHCVWSKRENFTNLVW